MTNEKVARSVALEQAYVHDVYEQFCESSRSRPWPRVQEFIEGLEPGSLVCDIGCGNGKYLNVSGGNIFNVGGEKCRRLCEMAHEKDNEVKYTIIIIFLSTNLINVIDRCWCLIT